MKINKKKLEKLIEVKPLKYIVPAPERFTLLGRRESIIKIKYKDGEYQYVPSSSIFVNDIFTVEELEMIIQELKNLNSDKK